MCYFWKTTFACGDIYRGQIYEKGKDAASFWCRENYKLQKIEGCGKPDMFGEKKIDRDCPGCLAAQNNTKTISTEFPAKW